MKCGRIEFHRKNIEAEQAVLGSVFFLDAETIIDAMEYIEPKRLLSSGTSNHF